MLLICGILSKPCRVSLWFLHWLFLPKSTRCSDRDSLGLFSLHHGCARLANCTTQHVIGLHAEPGARTWTVEPGKNHELKVATSTAEWGTKKNTPRSTREWQLGNSWPVIRIPKQRMASMTQASATARLFCADYSATHASNVCEYLESSGKQTTEHMQY